MILGYFDETKNAHADFVAMSGYLADDANWTALSNDWAVLLERHKIPYLHVADFIKSAGVYEELGWAEKAKQDHNAIPSTLDEFIAVIMQHTVFGVGIGLDAKKYREITDGEKKRSKPEVFCFERAFGKSLAIIDAIQHNDPICMIFDDSKDYSMKAYANLCEIKDRHPEIKTRVGLLGFGNDEILPPLQAADLLAYATQNLQDRGGNDAWLQHPQFSKLLSSDRPGYGPMYLSEHWNAEYLELQRDNIIAICRGKGFVI